MLPLATRPTMTLRIFVTLLLSTLLSLPALAQQTNSSSSAQPAASSNQPATPSQNASSGREPLRAYNPQDFWDGDDPNFGNMVMHPFARKKYVQRQVQPIRDRLSELDEITDSNTRTIKDVDARAQHGVELVSAKEMEADQHATSAITQAQMAQQAATQANTRVAATEQMVGNIGQYKAGSQVEIRFRPGQTVLSKEAKDALDQLATTLKSERSYIIEMQGFAPGHGQAAVAASQKMSDSVVRYLVLNHQVPVYRIYTLSMGNTPVPAVGGATARRASGGHVEISLLKNDMLSSTQH
jgi:outer membrane protein OmpA-like peptidoglycan-associated protein